MAIQPYRQCIALSVMPALPLSDQDVANVVTYVLNSFGNNGGQVSAAEVAEIKNK